MMLKERVKALRTEKGLSQAELARLAGITERSVQRYEAGASYPQMAAIEKLASALGTSVDDLLGREDQAIIDLGQTEGKRAQRDFLKQAQQFSTLMAGGDIPDEDREEAFLMIMEAYTLASKRAKKYTPKKYRKTEENNTENQ